MINLTFCELCNKMTNSMKYWFGRILCEGCYHSERSKPQTILVSDIPDSLDP